MAAGVIILAIVVTDFPNSKPEQKISEIPLEQIEEFPLEEAPIPQPTSNNSFLVGIWQDMPMMGSGWSNHYNFYPDGRYAYYVSQMKCDKRLVMKTGGWIVDGDKLVLTTTKEERLVGGTMVKSSGSCGTPMSLEGATFETIDLAKPIVETAVVTRMKADEGYVHETVMLGNQQFWKFDDDPTGQGEFIREN